VHPPPASRPAVSVPLRPTRKQLEDKWQDQIVPDRVTEEEVQQGLAYEEGANYDVEELDEDYIAEEEEESVEVEMEPKDEEQELPEPPMNDLVAVMAQ